MRPARGRAQQPSCSWTGRAVKSPPIQPPCPFPPPVLLPAARAAPRRGRAVGACLPPAPALPSPRSAALLPQALPRGLHAGVCNARGVLASLVCWRGRVPITDVCCALRHSAAACMPPQACRWPVGIGGQTPASTLARLHMPPAPPCAPVMGHSPTAADAEDMPCTISPRPAQVARAAASASAFSSGFFPQVAAEDPQVGRSVGQRGRRAAAACVQSKQVSGLCVCACVCVRARVWRGIAGARWSERRQMPRNSGSARPGWRAAGGGGTITSVAVLHCALLLLAGQRTGPPFAALRNHQGSAA